MMFRIMPLVFMGVTVVSAQNIRTTDYQFRLPVHVQHIQKDKHMGFAGWWVLPNMRAPDNTFRSLVVGGVVYKQPKRWIEIMGGAIIPQTGKVDPLFNVRILDKSIRSVNVFTDLELLPRTKRFYSLTSVDVPLKLGRISVKFRKRDLRVGGEAENILFWGGKPHSLGLGLRGVLPLAQHVSFTTAYQFRNDRNFLRNYLAFNF